MWGSVNNREGHLLGGIQHVEFLATEAQLLSSLVILKQCMNFFVYLFISRMYGQNRPLNFKVGVFLPGETQKVLSKKN